MGTNDDWQKLMQKFKGRRLTRAQAIRLYCKHQCCTGDLHSWQNCSFFNCFLWRFRLGREILGNKTSFKKQRAKHPILEEKQSLPKGGEVQDEN